MTDKEYQKFNRRYNKFINNNLPTPFWDDERQVKEYVYFYNDKSLTNNNSKLEVNQNLTDALGDIAFTSLYYPYTSKCVKYENKRQEVYICHNHSHSFEDVVNDLYFSPKSFKISKKEEIYYSKQELEYLKRVQKYLLFIGLKDINTLEISQSRYQNKIHQKYENAFIYKFNDYALKKILNAKRDFRLIEYYKGFKPKIYKSNEYQALIVDKNNNFKLFVEFTYDELKKYKDIKKLCNNKELKDNDKVIICHFKILEIFK